PAADGNLARGAVVDIGRTFAADLSEALGGEGLRTSYPLVIWRDREGYMKACACSDSRAWAFVRDDLDAPERIDSTTVPADGVAPADAVPGDGGPGSLPYPTLPPLALPDGASAPGEAPTTTAPARPATPPAPRKAPEPKKSDDTTFF
ncbi:MAG: hypothetical protein K0M78_04390, partial [Brevundimonas sp.]|nr:hypothetical protein [Brevundimonas sp.]